MARFRRTIDSTTWSCHPEGGSATEGSTRPNARFFAAVRCAQNDSAIGQTHLKLLLVACAFAAASPTRGEPTRNIVVDGLFNDWALVPSYSDAADNQHDTDHDGQFDTPAHVAHDDVDLLEYKFTHDEENLYAYFRSRGVIGRTQQQAAGTPGRYYVIVTIDVDNDDTTGYWLHEGGYYPTSRGYDMNMELEFYDGSWNTGHYLSHDALSQAAEDQDTRDLTSNGWNGSSDGPFTPGFVQPAPGNYDNYTQWSYHDNDTLTLVRDRGPIVPGIMTMALSPDGHEIEFRAPFKGFLDNAAGDPNIALGKTLDISFSLEASSELAAGRMWGSNTGAPIIGYVLGVPEPSSLALLLIGLLGLGPRRARRP